MLDFKSLDPEFDEYLAHMIAAQEFGKDQKGAYAQVCEDGRIEGDEKFVKPDDAALTFSTRVDVYEAPGGFGYSVTAIAIDGKDTWERTKADGPEAAHRTHGWRKVNGPSVSL